MTITMTTKNQVTLPKKIVDALRLHKGSLFDIKLSKNHIELVPVETKEKEFTEEDYKRMDKLFQKEKSTAKKVTKEFINRIA